MKQATFVKVLDQITTFNVQKLFKIEPTTFTVAKMVDGKYGDVDIETEYIVASASDIGQLLREEYDHIGLKSGIILSMAESYGIDREVMIFAADSTGWFTVVNQLFQMRGALSIQEAMNQFGYETVGEDSPYDEALK